MYVYIHTDDLSSYIHTRTQDKANKKRDRSQIVLEVKPTDTDVNLDDLYSTIKKEISPSGLTCACVARVVCCLQGGARSLSHLVGSDSLLACHDSCYTGGEGYNKVPVAFGIFKLVISMVVFDDEVRGCGCCVVSN